MNVIIRDTFEKQLQRIKDVSIIARAEKAVEKIEYANSFREITNVEYMQGHTGYYRLRFGDYRIGFYYTEAEQKIELIAIDHRSKIYRNFP
jgi:mRNA-degrading endonuclease RelE of RelBE toxin-antitoxin system